MNNSFQCIFKGYIKQNITYVDMANGNGDWEKVPVKKSDYNLSEPARTTLSSGKTITLEKSLRQMFSVEPGDYLFLDVAEVDGEERIIVREIMKEEEIKNGN